MKKLLSLIIALTMLTSQMSVFAKEAEVQAEEKPKSDIQYQDYPSTGNALADAYIMYFNEIYNLYNENHVLDFTQEELFKKTIANLLAKNPYLFGYIVESMLSTMDRYSAFYPADSGFLSLDNLSYGMTFEERKDTDGKSQGIFVSGILPGSNAEKSGLLPGDKILSVMGIPTDGLHFNSVSYLLRKSQSILISMKKRTPDKVPTTSDGMQNEVPMTELIIERNGEKITILLTKGYSQTEEVSSYCDDDSNALYIGISSFISEELPSKVKDILVKAKNDGYKNIVLDLRDNPGGSVDIAKSIINMFITATDEILYYSQSSEDKEPMPVYSDGTGMSFEKIAILVNSSTASASELLAVTLKKKCGAVLIGENTFGKAMGQSAFTFSNGDTVTVTSTIVYDCDMICYDAKGLEVDIAAPMIERKFTLPALEHFNHQNYKTIKYGEYNEATLALEKRLNLMNYLVAEEVDGIFDDKTRNAIMAFQAINDSEEVTGILTDTTVKDITSRVNELKFYYYFEDGQTDVAFMYCKNLSQAKRLAKENIKENEKTQEIKREIEKARAERVKEVLEEEKNMAKEGLE